MKRKDGILHSAIEIIDERGFHGFTIRELSKRQNISEAAIYRHFNNKNDILKSLLEHYSDYYNKICETIKTENMSALQAINFYITSYYEYYENYPEMISFINSYDLFSYEEEISDLIYEIVYKRFDFITELFQKGINDKELDDKISAESLAHIMMGMMTSVTLAWKLGNYNFSLKDKIQLISGQIKPKIIK